MNDSTGGKRKVDERTYKHILSIVDTEDGATEEEICTNCDCVIRYVHEDGKRVITCPECGTINPLCNECARHEKCSECGVSRMCEELNKQRADALPKPEEAE